MAANGENSCRRGRNTADFGIHHSALLFESRNFSAPTPHPHPSENRSPGLTLVLILIEYEGLAAGLCCSATPRLFI